MTSQALQSLIDYHYWARDRVLDATAALDIEEFVRPRGSSFSSIRDTLAHTYFAEWVWYSRWQGQFPTEMPSATQFENLDALRRRWAELEVQFRAFTAPMSDQDVARVLEYRLFSGVTSTAPIWQMVQHVVNHASYHRGQVTTMLRQAGVSAPKSMDLITFYREQAAR
jgi:uncharacterized damage-inducible protein DinB